jgi:penicillin-binding protein-related factor A (putative recombinase)
MTIRDWLGQLQATQEAPETAQERKRRGASSQAQGASFERVLEREAELGGVLLTHVPPPVRVLRREGRVVICRLEPSCAPDYLGAAGDGTALALEAKSTQTQRPSWELPEELAGHQGQRLAQVVAQGGIGAVLLRWDQRLYLLPWPQCDPRPARQSLRREMIQRWEVPAQTSWTAPLGSKEAWAAYCQGGWG